MLWLRISIRNFNQDRRGSVALIFALSLIVLFGVIGLSVDGARVYSASSKLNAAADSAALAAAKLLDDENSTDADVKALAQAYFTAHAAHLGIDLITINNFNALPNRDDNSVAVSADVSVRTTFGQIAGVEKIDFQPQATVVYKNKKIELALVLDITGSMSGDKIAALKTAAKDMVDTLFASNPQKGAVKVSLIPYSASVNAGGYASAASGGASTDDCVTERGGGGAYNDDAPGSGRYVGTSSTADHPGYSCPGSEIVELTDLYRSSDRNNFKAKIDALSTSGWTAGHIGLAWGWYSVSPRWNSLWPSSGQPRDYDKDKVIKAVVLMTDGMFNTAYRNGGELATDEASSTNKNIPGTSGNQALSLCDKMRNPSNSNEYIRLFTVAFQAPADAQALLQECSGVDNYISAENSSQLIESFQKIASKLTAMQLTK